MVNSSGLCSPAYRQMAAPVAVLQHLCLHINTRTYAYMQKRMEESKYGSFTIPQLKEELRKRNARLTGRKRELVERYFGYLLFLSMKIFS